MKMKDESGIVSVRLTEDAVAHIWPGGRILIEGRTVELVDLIAFLKTVLLQRTVPLRDWQTKPGYAPHTRSSVEDTNIQYTKHEKELRDMIEKTVDGMTGSITDIPGWQNMTPEQQAVSSFALSLEPPRHTCERCGRPHSNASAICMTCIDEMTSGKNPRPGDVEVSQACSTAMRDALDKLKTGDPFAQTRAASDFGDAMARAQAAKQSKPIDQVIKDVMQDRESVYGPPHLSHENIGLAWTALLQNHYGIRLDHPIPYWLVELMMTSYKLQRSTRVYKPDNYLDAKAYIGMAEHGQSKPGEPFTDHRP